jgi:hypothetical protein
MSNIVQVPVVDNKLVANFPDTCACCGAVKETESAIVLAKLVARGQRQVPINVKFKVPHCQRCARTTNAVFLAGCIPFVLGFVLIGLAVFFSVAFFALGSGLDEHGKPGNSNSLVLGAASGFFAGLLGAFLFEVFARVVLLPFMGRGLFDAPLLAIQLLKDSHYVAGLNARLNADASHVEFNFTNTAIAAQFAELNERQVMPRS